MDDRRSAKVRSARPLNDSRIGYVGVESVLLIFCPKSQRKQYDGCVQGERPWQTSSHEFLGGDLPVFLDLGIQFRQPVRLDQGIFSGETNDHENKRSGDNDDPGCQAS